MKKYPVSELVRFFFGLGLLFALGGQVRAWTIEWTKYDNTIPANADSGVASTNGKIPLGNDTRGDDAGTLGPSVIKDGATYKMWYGGSDGANWRIYYATSSNGLEWSKYDNTIPANADSGVASTNGKIPLGTAGKGDVNSVISSFVFKDGSTYKMWYTASDAISWRIYYATSSNGLEWTKYDNTIPAASDGSSTNGKIPLGTAGRGDVTYTIDPWVIKIKDTYKMWYGGFDAGSVGRVYHATSSNGLEWTKLDNTIPPVSDTTNSNSRVGLGTTGKGDDAAVRFPAVIFVGGRDYKMWYGGYDGLNWRIYHATGLGPPPAGIVFISR